jgi:hypothetical protein
VNDSAPGFGVGTGHYGQWLSLEAPVIRIVIDPQSGAITYGDLVPLGHERSEGNTTVRLRPSSIERDGLAGSPQNKIWTPILAERGNAGWTLMSSALRPARLPRRDL